MESLRPNLHRWVIAAILLGVGGLFLLLASGGVAAAASPQSPQNTATAGPSLTPRPSSTPRPPTNTTTPMPTALPCGGWRQVPSPNSSYSNFLNSVAAASSLD